MRTCAEELLVTRPSGRHGLSSADVAVTCALVAELAGRERVTLDDRRRLQVVDAGATGDPLLDEALLRLEPLAGKTPKAAMRKIGKGMAAQAYERLAMAELVDVLDGRREPDLRTGTLISLLRATSSLRRALPSEVRVELTMWDVRRRAREVSKGRWAGEAVGKAIEEMSNEVMAAVAAAGAVSSS